MNRFVFGRPVVPAKPVADGTRNFFVLGAYPSALHVQWRLPHNLGLIRAIAVDNGKRSTSTVFPRHPSRVLMVHAPTPA